MPSGHAALRKGRCSIAGQLYLVTFTTHRRTPHFATWPIAATAARLLAARDLWNGTHLLAWVLMPDHWHGIVQLQDGDALSRVIGRCKGGTAKHLRDFHPELGRIWAPGFHDRAIRKQEDLRPAARYVVMNPVRAGLADSVRSYPYWNAVWL